MQQHGINMGAGNQPGTNATDLAAKLAGTGVQWAYVPVFWAWLEPNQAGTTYWGPYASRYHDYDAQSIAVLDSVVQSLQTAGVTVVFQLRSQPAWAGGSSGDVIAAGNPASCGIIKTELKPQFRNNFADFAYFLAGRYPGVQQWAIGNEVNLDYYFSPQPPLLDNSVAAEYMDLMLTPAKTAILSKNAGATVFGAELFTCPNSGGGCTQTDRNWGTKTSWTDDWASSLLQKWPGYFPRFSIHNYSDDDAGSRNAVSALQKVMAAAGQSPPIWVTEFNFRSGTCENTEREIADWTCKLYKHMTWERAFYFDLQGNGCFSLLGSDGTPKPFLYPAFKAIVAGVYGCA